VNVPLGTVVKSVVTVGYFDLSSVTLTNIINESSTIGIALNRSTLVAKNLDMRAATALVPNSGIEAVFMPISLMQSASIKSSKFSAFQSNIIGVVIVSDSYNVVLEDIIVDGALGQQIFLVTTSTSISFRRLRVSAISCEALFVFVRSTGIKVEELKLTGTFTKPMIYSYNSREIKFESISLDSSVSSKSLFLLSSSQLMLKKFTANGIKGEAFFIFPYNSQIDLQEVTVTNFDGVFGSFAKCTLTGTGFTSLVAAKQVEISASTKAHSVWRTSQSKGQRLTTSS
jgi:hypothetical protein